MPRVSQYPVSNKVWEEMWTHLVEIIARHRREKQVTLLIDNLTTPNEKITIAKRLMIQIMLINNFGYSQIVGLVKVSTATVQKQRELLLINPEYEALLKKAFPTSPVLSQDEKAVEKFLNYLGELGAGYRDRKRLFRSIK